MYGALFSVLFLQLFVVVAAPFATRVGYPLVMAVPSGVATTVYPGPVLIVAAVAAGFAVTLATPRRYYGTWVVVIVIALTLPASIVGAMGYCYNCTVIQCNPYPVASCSAGVGLLHATVMCTCQS